MQWWLTTLITAYIVMLAHHLGLVYKVADVISQIAEAAGDGSWQIPPRAEIRRVSELLAMAINGRRAKVSNNRL